MVDRERQGLVSPVQGVVTALEAAVGDRVPGGAVLLRLESMKMEVPVVAPPGGAPLVFSR